MTSRLPILGVLVFILGWIGSAPICLADEPAAPAVQRFEKDVRPILQKYCYGCHGEGEAEGKVAFDVLKTDAQILDHTLWLRAIKNLRGEIMPPEGNDRPTAEEMKVLEDWIKRDAFAIDFDNPDPGRVTLRRLNRAEYRNTIRDLIGYDFKAEEEFPPDDTGYGFDNIGDVLTISPLLLEKYMQAAEVVVNNGVGTTRKAVDVASVSGTKFMRGTETYDGPDPDRVSIYDGGTFTHTHKITQPGEYRIVLEYSINGSFDFDKGKGRIAMRAGESDALYESTHIWENGKRHTLEAVRTFDQPADLALTVEMTEIKPPATQPAPDSAAPMPAPAANAVPADGAQSANPPERRTDIDIRIIRVRIEGPLDEARWVTPANYSRFFHLPEPPDTQPQKDEYAREVLRRFANRALRRPVDPVTLDRLFAIASDANSDPEKKFEYGIQQAMIALLASPRFIFRIEETASADPVPPYALLDEYALASRLSYFLWSTMPDAQLFDLADKGQLRANLAQQVERMVADPKSEAFVQNFVGQWLQVRDIDNVPIDARIVLARDAGIEGQIRTEEETFRKTRARRDFQLALAKFLTVNLPNQTFRAPRPRRSTPQFEMNDDIRRAMKKETEMYFSRVVHENRSVLELIESNYTYLNEKLAKHYGIKDVKGPEMRLVVLPDGSPRGGVLTQGSILAVTSNPTRTSPVKRGLFVLDNFLGVPPPPPPADIPALEESESKVEGHEPTVRETLEIHRSSPLCHSCHARMDPLGLAMENFNAMGIWRDKERNQPIDVQGQLVSGEKLTSAADLKKVIVTDRRHDYYSTLTEKMMTYALGRGPEYYDVHTIDQIVEKLDTDNGRFNSLLMGIVESPAFQKRRSASASTDTTVAAGRIAP